MTVRYPIRWTLVLIIVVSAVLRGYGLGVYPYEQDELYTLAEATELFDTSLKPGIAARPLYYLMQHQLLGVLPETPVALRVLPFLFGVLGIGMTYVLGARFFGTTAGLAAAWFVAISPWHLHASGMARYWTLVYVLAAAAFLLLWQAQVRDRPRDYVVALLVMVLGTATHPTFLFPLTGFVVGLSLDWAGGLSIRWPSRTAWRFLWGPFALLLLVAYVALAATGSEASLRNWDGRGTLATLRLLPAAVEWMTPTMFAAGGLGAMVAVLDRQAPQSSRIGLAGILGLTSASMLLLTAAFVTNVYADYGMAALPLVFLFAGNLVQLVVNRASSNRLASGVVTTAVLTAGVLPGTVSHLSDGSRFDYRLAYQHVRRVDPSIPVFTTPMVLQQHYAPDLTAFPLDGEPGQLESTLAREGELWAVVSVRRYGILGDGTRFLERWLAANCRLELSTERPRLDYRRYRVELHRCSSGPNQSPEGALEIEGR